VSGPDPVGGTPVTPAADEPTSAFAVLRRGIRESPELRAGIGFTLAMALAGATGRVLVPILIQQIIDNGLRGPHGFRPGYVFGLCGAAAVGVCLIYLAGRGAFRRLVWASEYALRNLRVRVFAHIHELNVAEQSAEKRGALTARVTADIDTLTQFFEWGGLNWIVSFCLMAGTLVAMIVYSWRLTILVLVVASPIILVLRSMQRRILVAYELVRTRVGETMSAISETVMGAAVVRAYGLEARVTDDVRTAVRHQYDAQMRANRYSAAVFPQADLFGGLTVAAVVLVGSKYGPGWGMTTGRLVAFLFLVTLFLQPVAELSEVLDQTQTAIAAWRKVLGVLDTPVSMAEPEPGSPLPEGALSVRTEGLCYAYEVDQPVLRHIDVDVPAGMHVAVVGRTGSGKTTFAKLLCRLADPTSGRIVIGGVDLHEVAPDARRAGVRMVPQDGFLFDTTIRENVRWGQAGATDADVDTAFAELGLSEWVAGLPDGLETVVGERGEHLSVGERQLVALVRAQLGSPGLLILDEATSAVDPETERAIGVALERLSAGRTTVAIAHRLSTAESADLVLVFDQGRIVERGTHAELVSRGGVYGRLYQSWLGNTQAA
jgi:ATP-binding cassette, subfamily B, bacterial